MSQKGITHLHDVNLVRALAHPLRARVLGILEERRASPRELADELGAPLGTVSYHVRTLAQLKLIKLVKKTPRRGAIEHHYEAVGVARVSDRAWAETPAIVKNAMVRSALGDVARSVNEAAALGGFDRPESHLTRSRLTLDEQGWKELADELTKLVAQAEKIHSESEKRLRQTNHEGERHSTLVMMLFEGVPAMDGLPVTDGAGSEESGAVPRQRKRRPVPQAAG
ncbi:MAG: winged helix-turn-helix domain-containing protein [Actinomycetota bacterium]|nr:winged helix-turn-helix domain-containing protein [Actinomycetota bacterium]